MTQVISKGGFLPFFYKKLDMRHLKHLMVGLLALFAFGSCGPVVLTARPDHHPPPWFYPNRLEVVRYVYFPEFHIYYDLSYQGYLYFENGAWIRVKTLPPAYRRLNLNGSRFVRIRDYQGDDIERYRSEKNLNRGRSNLTTPRKNN